MENRPGTRSPRQPATESSNDTSDNVEKKVIFVQLAWRSHAISTMIKIVKESRLARYELAGDEYFCIYMIWR